MATSKKIDPQDLMKAMSKAGVINERTTVTDLLLASSEISRGSETNLTVVYDDDKYFAVMP